MKTRRNFLNIAGAAALASVGFTAQAQAQETLNLHQMLPPQASVPSQILEPWMAKVAEESNGTLRPSSTSPPCSSVAPHPN